MKKIVLSTIVASSMFAATDAEILSLYSNVPKEIKVSIVKREKLDGGYDAVVLKFSKGDMSQEQIVFTKDDYMFPDIINIKTKTPLKREIEQKMLATRLKEVYSKEDPQNIIKLGDDPKKPTLLIFTEPNCPFCKEEMKKIEERLKTNNLELILTSVHGEPGFAKSYKVYEEIRKAKTDKEKLDILHKYYTMNGEVSGVDKKNIKELEDLATKYQSIGVTGVPMIIPKDSLK